MYSRRTRILILGAVITAGLLGVFLLEAPEPTRTVDELMEEPASYMDREIAVRGEIVDGSIDENQSVFYLSLIHI